MPDNSRDTSDPALVSANSNGLMSQEDKIKLDALPTIAALLAMISDSQTLAKTITPTGITGNQVINTPLGTVNFAAAATSLTVTSNIVTAQSLVFHVCRTNDADAVVDSIVPADGSFQIFLSNPANAEMSVGFRVYP